MKRNVPFWIGLAIIVVVAVVAGIIWYYMAYPSNNYPPNNSQTNSLTPTTTVQSTDSGSTASSSLALPVIYSNNTYGFTFSLPADWQGYTIVTEQWTGSSASAGMAVATGTELLIRNPNWTPAQHYEDIPILILTLAQWNSYEAGNFNVSPAPIPAGKIGQNNRYVFALPPRWDFDFSTGYQEAEMIVDENPLVAFNL